ncbi:unnamed protein product [Symbiodinium sp. KB8]|nr:unnamed protein product [Symbiodinium sp. KB8]
MALRRDVHSASSLLSGLSFMLEKHQSVESLEKLEKELQTCLRAAQKECKPDNAQATIREMRALLEQQQETIGSRGYTWEGRVFPDIHCDENEEPRVLDPKNLSRLEKQKIRRIVMPKPGSGNLEVPPNFMKMWEQAGTQRDQLFSMWAKAGGVKAVFLERVEILSQKTRKKKLTVKGGFYSKEDMKTENRIEKIVKWAESKGLVRTCEYDEETLEYWVNIRTEGELSREDLERVSHTKSLEGEGASDIEQKPLVLMDDWHFDPADPMFHQNGNTKAASQISDYLREILKAKNSLDRFLDKLRSAANGKNQYKENIQKLEALLKEVDNLYEELADMKAVSGAQGDRDPPFLSPGSNNTKPWEKEGGPILEYLMLGQDGPAFFRPDFFHVYHSGVGKDFLGSSFVYAMKKLFNCGSVDKDLFALNEYLRRFLKGSKLYLHCGSLSVDTLGYSGTRDYPEGHWSKNADTAVLMRFLVTLLQQEKFSQTVRHDEILSQMLHSAIAMGHFMRRSLQSSYFMPSDDCEYVIQAVAVKTLQRYDTWVRTALVKDDMSILDLSWLD